MQPVARIVSAEGFVSVGPVSGPQAITVSAGTQLDICVGESVGAGPRSRAAVVLLASNQIIRVDQNTTVRILEPVEGQRTLIELLQGFIRLFNPVGRALDVRTPFVTAGTEGTEFFVSYDPQTADTTAGVMEGFVRVSTTAESVRLAPGEAVRARQAGALQRLNIRPADAVRWAIFYPPAIWSLPPPQQMALDPDVRDASQAWRDGNLPAFAAALNLIPRRPLDAQSLLRFAALLLVAGQVDEASQAIDRAETLYSQAALMPLLRPVAAAAGPQAARASAPSSCRPLGPGSALIPALRSIIAVARNQTDEALALSDCALSMARASGDQAALAGAAVARSYALQSAFRLPEARQVLATVAMSDDPLVLARLAELDLSLGDNASALREAQRASEIAPSLSLTSSILGFSALANFDFPAARAAFTKAAAQSPGDPLPPLGLGLTAIRAGDLEEGRQDLVIAVGLDPESSVARSYLGRTYANLRVYDGAFREWALAEASDPNDPTASLYRAFAERALNRPVDALRDIEKSIALNGNRAVYRSRLLLDQDLATRTTGLASVYRDLGFDQLALSQGYKSVDEDPANPGAHRFLSDSYLAVPRHETASDSELLQSLLLQPINVQPLRPRLAREGLGIIDLQGPFRVGFNEFSPLFAADGLSLLGDGFGGTHGTYGDNLVLSGIRQNASFSAGQFYYATDGIRPNDQLRRDTEDGLVQVALSDRVSVLGEYRHSALHAGDISHYFDPNSFTLTGAQTEDRAQYRLGGRVNAVPGITVVGVWTQQHLTATADTGLGFTADTTQKGDFGEVAVYFSRPQFNVVAGGGYFDGHLEILGDFFGSSFVVADTDVTHANAWIYGTVTPLETLRLTLGASFDQYRSDIKRDHISPKAGLSWDIAPGSVLRAAYFETLKRTTTGGQTVEPTQIAGFNQLFDDPDATRASSWGIGFDQKLGDQLFAGVEWSKRELNVPIIIVSNTIEQPWKEDAARAYLNWIATERFSVNFGVQWERLVRDPEAFNTQSFADLDLIRLPLEFRYSDSSGIFALLRTTLVRETGHFLDTNTFMVFGGRETFAVVDAGVGWRFPGRGLVGSLLVKNLFNSGFRFQDTDPANPTISPRRLVMGRVTWSF